MSEIPGPRQKFRLKPMVIIRLFAEMSVLLILVLLPVVLLLNGQMAKAAIHARIILFGLATAALVALPAYGFVTYEVTVDRLGITARSLFKKNHATWDGITALKLATSWGWRRYVVKHKDGDLSFPVWVNGVKELTQMIRARLPGGGRTTGGGARTYSQDLVNVAIQFGKLLISLAFIALFWTFFASIQRPQADKTDMLIILGACLILTLMMLLRSAMIALMPKSVTVESDSITLRTFFFERRVMWTEVISLGAPLFFLPPGLFLKTRHGWFLIGEQFEAVDELEEDLIRRLPPARKA